MSRIESLIKRIIVNDVGFVVFFVIAMFAADTMIGFGLSTIGAILSAVLGFLDWRDLRVEKDLHKIG